jgi:hypothetical protein
MDKRLGNNGEQEDSATAGNQIPVSHYQTSHTQLYDLPRFVPSILELTALH